MLRLKTFIWTVLLISAAAIFTWGFKPELLDQLRAYAAVETPANAFYSFLNTNLNLPGGPYRLLAQFIGACLLSIVILLPFMGRGDKPTGSIILKKAKGNVEVKLASVQECLIRAARRDPDVKAAKVVFSGKGRGMKIQVNTIIWEMPDVPAKVEQVQFMLENRFKELMGPLSEDIRIDVVLRKIAARKDGEYPETQKSLNAAEDLALSDFTETVEDTSDDFNDTVEILK